MIANTFDSPPVPAAASWLPAGSVTLWIQGTGIPKSDHLK